MKLGVMELSHGSRQSNGGRGEIKDTSDIFGTHQREEDEASGGHGVREGCGFPQHWDICQ